MFLIELLLCVCVCMPLAVHLSPIHSCAFFLLPSFSPRAIIQSNIDRQCIASSHQHLLIQIDNYQNKMTWNSDIWAYACMFAASNKYKKEM